MKGGPSEGVASHQRPVIKGSTLHLSEILRARGTVLHTHSINTLTSLRMNLCYDHAIQYRLHIEGTVYLILNSLSETVLIATL